MAEQARRVARMVGEDRDSDARRDRPLDRRDGDRRDGIGTCGESLSSRGGPTCAGEARTRVVWSQMLVPPLALKIAAAAGVLALSWHLLASSTAEPPPAPNGSGQVRFVKDANTSFDPEDVQANATWINRHLYRMTGYAPWFDRNLGWYHRARVYADAYAIYRGSTVASRHPGWIVRDAAGNRLYIPFQCSRGSCPLFAADISNRAWRSYYVSTVKAAVTKGYEGVFVDDVDMWANTSNGAGQLVAPIDHNTGKPMTDEVWRSYMVRFMEELRAAIRRTRDHPQPGLVQGRRPGQRPGRPGDTAGQLDRRRVRSRRPQPQRRHRGTLAEQSARVRRCGPLARRLDRHCGQRRLLG